MGQFTREQWDEWFRNRDEKSLDDLLEGFYKGFDIADYLDQIGVIDDRLKIIRKGIESVLDRLYDTEADPNAIDDLEIIQNEFLPRPTE